ncbi:MAG: hypothetical protein WCR52_20885 [Bacteroidota bacterium]
MNYYESDFTETKTKDGIEFTTYMPNPLEGMGCISLLLFLLLIPTASISFALLEFWTATGIVGAGLVILMFLYVLINRRLKRPKTITFGVYPNGFYNRNEKSPLRNAGFQRDLIRRFYLLDHGTNQLCTISHYRYELILETIHYEDYSVCLKAESLKSSLLRIANAFNTTFGIETAQIIEPYIQLIGGIEMSQSLARKLAKEKD